MPLTYVIGSYPYKMEPVFTAMFALFLPAIVGAWLNADVSNETITAATIIGGVLITAANVLIAKHPHSHPPE